jgi:hypothetical protein
LSGDRWTYVLSSLGIVASIFAGNWANRHIARWYLKRKIPAYFIIPSSRRHECDFAYQTSDEHRSTTIVVGVDAPVIVDLVFEPRREMTSSQVLAEFDGDLSDKPLILNVNNRFIEVGPRRNVVPGEEGNSDYIDKHKGYHAVESINWSANQTKTFGFTIFPRNERAFSMTLTAIGDLIEVSTAKLTLLVRENPVQYIGCCRKEHFGEECQLPGIRPKHC